MNIETREIGDSSPVYFIADIAANHDGSLERAQELIFLAAEAGADAAKFQHFQAKTIVSDEGFKSLGSQQSHQAQWKKTVFEVYQDASVPLDWTQSLRDTCIQAGISFFTSPYSIDLVDQIDPFVPAYKIGSGDITWIEIVRHIASKNKPTILATGASSFDDVHRAVSAVLDLNNQICLMQCNTNYTGNLENLKYVNLNVLKSYRSMYPNMILGLSDHTPGHSTVLGAVALGARMIEKHFTDDTSRTGPDHAFSMDFKSWREMVYRTRELESALGIGVKKIEDNELETSVLQRRCLRLNAELLENTILTKEHVSALRPCPKDGLPPYVLENVLGKCLSRNMTKGEYLQWIDLK